MASPNSTPIPPQVLPPKSYALSGKIMLCSIIVLFTVVVLMLFLHIYARWHLLRRTQRRRRARRLLIFTSDVHHPAGGPTARRGLDPAVLNSLPVFVHSDAKSSSSDVVMECAVCLCEFQENEKGRTLPRCNHSFHVECIDMWFSSHSTCPLCRSTVVPTDSATTTPVEISNLCDSCRHDGGTVHGSSSSLSSSSTSSTQSPRSPGGGEIRIEVPQRRTEEELKSPVSRMLSFKRILSLDLRLKRGSGGGCSSTAEPDLERGEAVEEGQLSPATTPPPR